jgi:hypothetical protein
MVDFERLVTSITVFNGKSINSDLIAIPPLLGKGVLLEFLGSPLAPASIPRENVSGLLRYVKSLDCSVCRHSFILVLVIVILGVRSGVGRTTGT